MSTEFKSIGEFYGAAARAVRGGRTDPRLVRDALLGGSSTSGQDGAFMVPLKIAADLLELTYEQSVLAKRCHRFPAAEKADTFAPSINEESRVDGSRFGGVGSGWIGQGEAIPTGTPKWKRWDAGHLKKVGAVVYASEELVEDAPLLTENLNTILPAELSYRMDQAIVRGNGVQSMLGVLDAPATIEVSKETGQAADTICVENVLGMLNRLDARSYASAAWLINMECWAQLYMMAQVVGAGGVPVFSLTDTTLCGRPVIPVEQCATVGTVGDIVLADLSQYAIIEKPLKAVVSAHVAFTSNQVCFRTVFRCDGQPIWDSPVTPANGAATVSPFIVLESRD